MLLRKGFQGPVICHNAWRSENYQNQDVMEHLNAINGLVIFRNSDFPICGDLLA